MEDREKDSSRMLAAGADRVFYVQTRDEYLEDVWVEIFSLLNLRAPVIIESGGIHKKIRPGIALFISGHEQSENNHLEQIEYTEIIFGKNDFDSVIEKISYSDGCWKYQ